MTDKRTSEVEEAKFSINDDVTISASKALHKLQEVASRHKRLLAEMTADRDAWKKAHEDLLETRRQDIATLAGRRAQAAADGAGGAVIREYRFSRLDDPGWTDWHPLPQGMDEHENAPAPLSGKPAKWEYRWAIPHTPLPLTASPAPATAASVVPDELQEIADGAWGDCPRVRGLARDRAAMLVAAPFPTRPSDLAPKQQGNGAEDRVRVLSEGLAMAAEADEGPNGEGQHIAAGLFGTHTSAWLRKIAGDGACSR